MHERQEIRRGHGLRELRTLNSELKRVVIHHQKSFGYNLINDALMIFKAFDTWRKPCNKF